MYKLGITGGIGSGKTSASEFLYENIKSVYLFNADKEFKLISHNKISSDDSQFHGTPALSNGEIFLRSDKYLYCISE